MGSNHTPKVLADHSKMENYIYCVQVTKDSTESGSFVLSNGRDASLSCHSLPFRDRSLGISGHASQKSPRATEPSRKGSKPYALLGKPQLSKSDEPIEQPDGNLSGDGKGTTESSGK